MFQSEDQEDVSNGVVVDTETESIATELGRIEQRTFYENIEADDDQKNHSFDRTVNSSTSPTLSREITIEFLDSRNGEKFDRLVRDVKIVAPFIRRLSGNSRSNSPTASIFAMEEEHEISDEAAVAAAPSTIHQFDRQECSTMSNASTTTAIAAHTESEHQFGGANVAETATMNGDNQEENAALTTAAIIAHMKRRRYNVELETRADVLARRQKQIDYGKNTIGYDNYIKLIPRNKRSKDHPRTPPKEVKYSRRAFDGLVRIWRTQLHRFDPPINSNETGDNPGGCGFKW